MLKRGPAMTQEKTRGKHPKMQALQWTRIPAQPLHPGLRCRHGAGRVGRARPEPY